METRPPYQTLANAKRTTVGVALKSAWSVPKILIRAVADRHGDDGLKNAYPLVVTG
jgi:hypothetical protein